MSQIATDGPLSRSVRDSALALQVMAGPDPRDPQALPDTPDDYLAACERTDLSDLRIAWSPDLGHGVTTSTMRANAQRAVAALQERAGTLDEATPEIDSPIDIHAPLAAGGAVANYGHLWEEHREEMADYIQQRMQLGFSLTGEDVTKAYAALDKFRAQMRLFFDRYDVLLTPGTARGAYPHGAVIDAIDGTPINPLRVSNMFTAAFNLTQQPAASIPTGFDQEGLPTALQIVGRHGDEVTVFRVAAALAADPALGRRATAHRRPLVTFSQISSNSDGDAVHGPRAPAPAAEEDHSGRGGRGAQRPRRHPALWDSGHLRGPVIDEAAVSGRLLRLVVVRDSDPPLVVTAMTVGGQ